MNIAVVGLGGAGSRGHIPALTALGDRAALVAAADLDARRRLELASRLPRLPLFATAQEMLTHTACDVLVVATEPAAHAPLVTLGMQHGLHVVCEKPLTTSREAHEAIAQACARRPDLALVPVHQYRYSPHWASIVRRARRAARRRRPWTLTVDLQRPGTDPHAVSPWRTDVAGAGGMLADAGVHFLALAWTIDKQMEPLAIVREQDELGAERSTAILRIGSGVVTLQVWNGAPRRHTRVELRLDRTAAVWRDDVATLTAGERTLLRRRVPALSDREHVDMLYGALYRDLVAHVRHDGWRIRRTAEALGVGELLLTLLERGPVQAVAAP